MIYSDEFIETLPIDKVEAGQLMCSIFFEYQNNMGINANIEDYYLEFLDAYVALGEFAVANNIIEDYKPIIISDNKGVNIDIITRFFNDFNDICTNILRINTMETAKNRYKAHFANSFSYKFTDGDLKRIQTLINNLRDSINGSTLFEDNHKTRLLDRLEKLQKELHKKMSNIDIILGFIGDAGVVLGKFGEDARPLYDMIKEIVNIAWRTQATAEELPSGTSMPSLNE